METTVAGLQLPPLSKTPDWKAPDWKAPFAGAAVLPMKLAALRKNSPPWRPAQVHLGGTPGRLWILAELEDEEPISPGTGDQTLFYEQGDVFEIFLRPGGQEAYFELHVSPANERLSLRWPYAGKVRNLDPAIDPPLGPYLWDLQPLTSQVRLIPGFGWQALIALDLAAYNEVEPNEQPWLISFGRYDRSSGFENPVLSSTSEHAEVDFHRLHEWTSLTGVHAFL